MKTIKLKQCNTCLHEYPATKEFFHRNSATKDGLSSKCKGCFASNAPINLEKICEHCGKVFKASSSSQRFCSKDCRVAWMGAGRLLIFERDDFRCIYCGKSSIEDQRELNVDHIYPVSLGGQDIASNLVTACHKCNMEKHDNIVRNIGRIQAEVAKRNERDNIPATTIIHLVHHSLHSSGLHRIGSDD